MGHLSGKETTAVDKVLYIKPQKCILVDNTEVKINDVADVQSSDNDIAQKVKNMVLYTFDKEKTGRYVMSVIDIITGIQKEYPDVMVVNLGECDFILEYNMNTTSNKWLEAIKIILTGMIVFFGAAFAIMSFHEDVDIPGLFEDVYKLIIGEDKEGISVLEVAYSIGLSIGILIFYNRFGMGRNSNDPTPLEMEMKNYEETVNDTLILANDRGGSDN